MQITIESVNHMTICESEHGRARGRSVCLCSHSAEYAIILLTFFIITNLIHKFLVHSHKLHKIKFLYMFRAQSAYHQEVNDANCTYAAFGIVTLCKWQSCATAKEGCTRLSLAVSNDTKGCICTISNVDLLMMSGLRSKNVEEFNVIYVNEQENCVSSW